MIAIASLIQATALWGYREVVHRLGADSQTFLARFGIPRDADAREDEFISFPAFVTMLEVTAEELNCPELGLRLSRWQGLDVLGPVSVIARNSRTVGDAVAEVARYLYVHAPAMRLAPAPWATDDDLAFEFTVTEVGLPPVTQIYDLSMAVAVRILRLLGGPDAAPTEIALPYPRQASRDAYQDAVGCPVDFEQTWCGFTLSADLAQVPIATADTATRRMARKYLDSRYIPPSASLTDRVADLARNLMPIGQCSATTIADELDTPLRSLQRQLAAEGTSCQDVIDRERRVLAARYLANPDLQLTHVANLIGYTEQSALNRSCRRWFGQTPTQYRKARFGAG